MEVDAAYIEKKLRRWEKYINEYRLPEWEQIPDLGLYMEQVLALLTEYLDYLPPELKEEQFITAATINNYVRNRYMPKPYKKKYYRIHIAYLVMICTLKQSLTISVLTRMIPNDIPEEQVKAIYTAYRERHRIAAEFFVSTVRVVAAPILGHEERRMNASVESASDLISTYAILSGLSGLLAEKLLLLDGKPAGEQPAEAETSV
ncbi:MAG: DUF1836 domain-containing protein [Clostridia bacterium]|nr:DUF1836 domain-containing protein [Clostridia bacterium]MBQ4341487.1 DUF1836 domain-containing protein [Clostridia bacterium]MBR6429438.1 DUF1836 domain-containing protein [Clostridia bacterium]